MLSLLLWHWLISFCLLQLYPFLNSLKAFLKFLFSDSLRIKTFNELVELVFFIIIKPVVFVPDTNHIFVLNLLFNSYVNPCKIIFEVPILNFISIFAKHFCDYARLEQLLINFYNLILFALNSFLNSCLLFGVLVFLVS